MRYSGANRPSEQEAANLCVVNKPLFATFYERYSPGLCRYLTYLAGDTNIANDLTQDTFIKAYVHLSELTEPDKLLAWLYQIARNELRMQQRRAAIIHIQSIDAFPPGVVDRIAALQGPDAFATYEAWDDLQAALATLSPSCRDVLLLNRVAGFTTAEIAVMLGIPHDTARRRVTRGLSTLRMRHKLEDREA